MHRCHIFLNRAEHEDLVEALGGDDIIVVDIPFAPRNGDKVGVNGIVVELKGSPFWDCDEGKFFASAGYVEGEWEKPE